MKIVVANHAGFCFGVKNAIDLSLKAKRRGTVCTLGELIHNSRAIEELKRQGIHAKEAVDQIDTRQVVIRSHGATPQVFHDLAVLGFKVIDATCPLVKRIQREAKEKSEAGVAIIIIGDARHPEVVATKGWAGENSFVVDSAEDVNKLPELQTACVLGQTTYLVEKRDEIIGAIQERIPDAQVFDFICSTTGIRQREAAQLAASCDAVLVIGDRKSANTRKLYQTAGKYCSKTCFVQSLKDIPVSELDAAMTVGIVAGASTPPEEIEETIAYLKSLYPVE